MSKKEHKRGRGKRADHNQLKGTLEVTRSGIGFVVIAGEASDVLVRPNDFNTALNGDTVLVRVTKENLGNGKREGKISDVVARKQSEFIGHLQVSANFAFFIPDTDKPMPDIFIPIE